MARARNLKPGFFKNEDLAECTPWARLCFAGLWTLADKRGRLEDRPKRIKAELFAFDTVDVEPLLTELARRSFIVRYEIDGSRFIQISKFSTHQTPHYSEKESVIKAPPLQEKPPDIEPPNSGNTPGVDASSRGGRNPLNPSSPNPSSPNPSSSLLSQAPARPPAEPPQLHLVEPPESPPETAAGPPDCPHLAVLALWAELLPHLPQHDPARWRAARADHLRARWRETATEKGWKSAEDGLRYFRRLFGWIGSSPFLNGRATTAPGKRPFVLELEWLVERSNWDRVIEGKYHEEATA